MSLDRSIYNFNYEIENRDVFLQRTKSQMHIERTIRLFKDGDPHIKVVKGRGMDCGPIVLHS